MAIADDWMPEKKLLSKPTQGFKSQDCFLEKMVEKVPQDSVKSQISQWLQEVGHCVAENWTMGDELLQAHFEAEIVGMVVHGGGNC